MDSDSFASRPFAEQIAFLNSKPSYGALSIGTDLTSIGYSAGCRRDSQGSTAHDSMFGVKRKSSTATEDIPLADAPGYRPVESDDEFSIADAEDGTTGEGPAENSAYEEVRSCVEPNDDPSLPVSTLRMWVISTVFTMSGSAMNLLLSLRYPSIAINAILAQLLSYPLGKAWAKFVPYEVRCAGFKVKLNEHSHWNVKEHACVFMAANVSFTFAYATDILTEQIKFYNQDLGSIYQVALVLSSQIIGYAFAGMTSAILVQPGAMIWPSTLINCALFQVMHSDNTETVPDAQKHKAEKSYVPRLSRSNLFMLVAACTFFWHFFPAFVMPALSSFSVITWLFPKSVIVSILFGVRGGLGMLPLTFDWAQIAYIGNPLMIPWWAMVNLFSGFVVVCVFLALVFYYGNIWYSGFMPFLSSNIYDNTGNVYNVTRIVSQKSPDRILNNTFGAAATRLGIELDLEAYKGYSPIYLPVIYYLSIGVLFASLTALLTHCALYHGEAIVRGYQSVKRDAAVEQTDIHARLVQRYPAVPMAWYLLVLSVSIILGLFICIVYPLGIPWYGLLLACAVCGIFFVPIGFIAAATNQIPSTMLLCQLIAGTLYKGSPTANMIFQTFGSGLKFSSDMKLGQYLKVPPRTLFAVQLYATCLGALCQIGTLNYLFRTIPELCSTDAPNGMVCPFARVHFNSSVMWGLVGPDRIFGARALYRPLIYTFVLGAVLPVPIWWMERRSRKKTPDSQGGIWRWINVPVMMSGMAWIPPASGLNLTSWFLAGWISNQIIRRRAHEFWSKYNFILAASLDAGLAFTLVIGFLIFVNTGLTNKISWWGTDVFKQGCDWMGCARLQLAPGETFGLSNW